MDNNFSENESLYRAVYPPEMNRMYWKDEEHISSAVFLDKKGLSVERGNFRADDEVVKEMKKDWDEKVGDRMIKMVIIGRHLNKEEICKNLDACLD